MAAVDVMAEDPAYYAAAEIPEVVTLGAAHYLSIPGNGAPGQAIFYERIAVLRQAAQALQAEFDTAGMPFKYSVLEVLYWYDEPHHAVRIRDFYTSVPLSELQYRLLIRVPAYVTPAHIAQAASRLVAQGVPLAVFLAPFTFTVGKAVQVLHRGPLANEPATLAALDDFTARQGLQKAGLHHEIHLTDLVRQQSQTHYQTILRDQVAAR